MLMNWFNFVEKIEKLEKVIKKERNSENSILSNSKKQMIIVEKWSQRRNMKMRKEKNI